MASKMTRQAPILTVGIPCYNYGQYIEECIRSVYSQSVLPEYVIVINDGSTDNSHEVISRLQKKYGFKYLNLKNHGISAVRNKLTQVAEGDFLIQLDADDTLPFNYIACMKQSIQQNDADIHYTYAKNMESGDVIVNPPMFDPEKIKRCNYIHSSAAVSLEALGKISYDKALESLGLEDWDIYLGLTLMKYVAVRVEGTHLEYRVHPENASRSDLSRSGIGQLKAIRYIYNKYSLQYPEEMWGYGWLADNLYRALNLYGESNDRFMQASRTLDQVQEALGETRAELNQIKNSRSWRLVRNLRRVVYIHRKMSNKQK